VAVASAGLYASLHLIPDNHANIPPLSFLQAGCPSCCPTNSIKALKAMPHPLKGHTYGPGSVTTCRLQEITTTCVKQKNEKYKNSAPLA